MFEVPLLQDQLEALQWFAAIAFVPLVCWQYCLRQSVFCRWCALTSGYTIQVGFFLLLDDVGFKTEFLLLISSIAAYFWITTTVAMWPGRRKSRPQVTAIDNETPQATA